MAEAEIRIENARSHNLQGVSCRIPLRALTVVTGVSGSGKSSLAFDTLYAEGQRRYVTSLSTYARQFLERLARPDVDAISNLPPAIAIEQRNRVTGARSTVGTATEILDHLRLLFAKIGETRCPDCDKVVEPCTVESVADRILARWEGHRITVAAPLSPDAAETRAEELDSALRDRLVREGFRRVLDPDGSLHDLEELGPDGIAALRSDGALVIDRLALRPDTGRARVTEAVASAFARGHGHAWILDESGARSGFREGFACDGCQRVFPVPTPALFSFNSPLGACPRCQGFGRVTGLDLERVVPDPRLSLRDDAIAPFATPMGLSLKRDLVRACRERGVPVDRPFAELEPDQRDWVIDGDRSADAGEEEDEEEGWYGVRGFFDWLEGRRYKVQARMLIARYRRFDPCPECDGSRLRPEAEGVRVGGHSVSEISRWNLTALRAWLEALTLSPAQQERSRRLLPLLRARVETVDRVGLGYLAMDRQVRTLSGGEAQRIQLASALGGTLTAALYVLDEPSVGLHPRDVDRLLSVLRSIRDLGNTVVVVEHAPEIVAAADHLIELGPGAGRSGGRIVVEGDLGAVLGSAESPTGQALRGEIQPPTPHPRPARGRIRVVGARENNLKNLSLELPLGQLVVFTGVSGAGKSSLVNRVIVGQLRRDPERGECDAIEGADAIAEVVLVDQTPPVRSPRSNPATVSKAFDGIRKLFAATREARALGIGPGWFSFNVPGGRCDRCEGAGEVVIDMHFLDDVRVPCDACGGRRYRKDVLDIRVGGRSIVDVLELTLEEATEVFAPERAIAERLAPFLRVGLGYLQLGQPLSTLSGGEHQRLRLALALAEGGRDILYVLDEPTTGLHPADVRVLLDCLEGLLAAGSSVFVVEHNLDVIRHADHVVDLGPEGGPGGGALVVAGSPAEVAQDEKSYTAKALRAVLHTSLRS